MAKIDLEQLKIKIRQMSSKEIRTDGNINDSNIDRELARLGQKRKPEDIPMQDTVKRGKKIPGNVAQNKFIPSTAETRGVYTIGAAIRPSIVFDEGFSNLPKRNPKLSDYLELFKWYSMLEAAETLRPDLSDSTAAYRHFHEGEGKPRTFSYVKLCQ